MIWKTSSLLLLVVLVVAPAYAMEPEARARVAIAMAQASCSDCVVTTTSFQREVLRPSAPAEDQTANYRCTTLCNCSQGPQATAVPTYTVPTYTVPTATYYMADPTTFISSGGSCANGSCGSNAVGTVRRILRR